MKFKGVPFLTNAHHQFPNKIVKVPDFLKWQVIVSEANAIQALGSSSEHELSFLDAASEVLYTKFSDDLPHFSNLSLLVSSNILHNWSWR